MNKKYKNATAHIKHILHWYTLNYINGKKYKTVCAELTFA